MSLLHVPSLPLRCPRKPTLHVSHLKAMFYASRSISSSLHVPSHTLPVPFYLCLYTLLAIFPHLSNSPLCIPLKPIFPLQTPSNTTQIRNLQTALLHICHVHPPNRHLLLHREFRLRRYVSFPPSYPLQLFASCIG